MELKSLNKKSKNNKIMSDDLRNHKLENHKLINHKLGHYKLGNHKAIYYTLDALLSGFLLVGAILLMMHQPSQENKLEQKVFLSQDIINSLSELKIYEINNTFIMTEIANGNITDVNKSVLEQAGYYWVLNKSDKAVALLQWVINDSLPNREGLSVSIGSDDFMLKNFSTKKNLVTSTRMISGIDKGKPLSGASGSAYLKKISNKRNSAYAYYGGFVGQGNITSLLTLNGNISIVDVSLEMDVVSGSTFNIKINNKQCNDSTGNPLFTAYTPAMVVDTWNITNCSGLLSAGTNNISFLFTNISNAYILGGYFKVTYTTDQFQENSFYNSGITHLPGIAGVVNLFDSFYVPGDLYNLTVYLHYNINTSQSNNTFYLTIGNITSYIDNTSKGETNITLTDVNLTFLDYAGLSKSTIPIRIGFENLSFETIVTNGSGFGDVVLTTDVSGSMGNNFSDGSHTMDVQNCSNASMYNALNKKINVAKCLDINFTHNILLNTSLNRVGLVSYTTTTRSTLNLTSNENSLDTEINTYTDLSSTCISCGVVDSFYLLNAPLTNTTWKYMDSYQFSTPPTNWSKSGFDDSNWTSGYASFGYGAGTVTTTLNMTLTSQYANLWEFANSTLNDTPGQPTDFSSGVLNTSQNSTHITYGLNASGYDGWDWKGGVYGGTSVNVSLKNITTFGGNKKITINITGVVSRQTGDGSYGIQFNVTSAMYQLLQYSGTATLSVRWNWTGCAACNSNSDWAAVKLRLTNSSGSTFYLGSDTDPGDSTNAVYADNKKPTGSSQGLFSQDISSYIRGSGMYYLDFGGKLSRDSSTKFGVFYFDDVQINFTASPTIGNTYYRNTFQLTNASNMSNTVLYVASDDDAIIYLNGNLVDNDTTAHVNINWNRFVNVPLNYFQTGTNVLAVQLNNDDGAAYLDLQLKANVGKRQNALVLMTDGDANQCVTSWDGSTSVDTCNQCGGRACCVNGTTGQLNAVCPVIGTLDQAAVQFENISCYLHSKYNIGIFSVAFGTAVSTNGAKALNMSASCDNSTHFYTSNNVSGLSSIYTNIASSILSGFLARESQVIVFSGGNFSSSILYPDSYIAYNYTPIVQSAEPGEIELNFESPKFTNCTPQFTIPDGMRLVDAKIVSYSGVHWTNYLSVNGNEVYNLSSYLSDYVRLGDPFTVQIPPNYLAAGKNNFVLRTGDDSSVNTNCSYNNSFIYTALINSSISRSLLLPNKIGCNWTIESEDFVNTTIIEAPSITVAKKCYYTNATISYDPQDAYDYSVYEILSQLDSDRNGRIVVTLQQKDLEIVVLLVSGLPYMWGPSMFKVDVWQ